MQLPTYYFETSRYLWGKRSKASAIQRAEIPTRRDTLMSLAYFANPGHCSRLNGRPSVSLARIAVTQCSVSSRSVYITRHLSQLFVSGDIDSFLSSFEPRQLKLVVPFVAATGFCVPLLTLECLGSANTHNAGASSCSARYFVDRVSLVDAFCIFLFWIKPLLRVYNWVVDGTL